MPPSHSSSNIAIERFQPHQQVAVVAHILGIENNEFALGLTLEDQPDLKDIATHYQSGLGQFWVARNGDDVVGTVGLFDLGNGDVDLRKMFVSRAHRGGHPSLAQRMLDVALEWSATQGVSRIFLETSSKFPAAIRLYERNGFVPIARMELPSTFPVLRVAEHFYVRQVAASFSQQRE